jgi:hypothetical protein
LASYRHDALGRRIEYIDHANSVTTRYIYDGDNVVAEIDETDTAQRSYINGPQYIDERIVMYDEVNDANYYYLLQELYSVAGLVESNGNLAEMAVYDAYGHATLYDWPLADFDRDTDVDMTDYGGWLSCYNGPNKPPATYGCEDADFDYDGDVDMSDYSVHLSFYGGTNVDMTEEMTYSALGNPFWFTGRLRETLAE